MRPTVRIIPLLGLFVVVFALLAGLSGPSASAAGTTFVVNSTDDVDNGACTTNHCSLREAINAANTDPNTGTPTIAFNISGPGPFTILLGSALPLGPRPIAIDGSTQPGAFCGDPGTGAGRTILIELQPAARPSAIVGLGLWSSGFTVRGLAIGGFGYPTADSSTGWSTGIWLGSNNTVECSNVGTDASGTIAVPNLLGIAAFGSNNTIGGSTADKRNIISGNWQADPTNNGNWFGIGIAVTGWTQGTPGNSAVSGNHVIGNYIGTNAAGTSALPNGNGVSIEWRASGNTVGANVISGNSWAGVVIDRDSNGNSILGNHIGTNAAGTAAAGNNQGVQIRGATGNTIGGNVISGNRYQGISLTPTRTLRHFSPMGTSSRTTS